MSSDAPRDLSRSWTLWERASQVIPMASQTHSKAPREALRGIEPCFIDRGEGCRLWDIDGNEYLDFRCSLGPITLGYRYPVVEEAVIEQVRKGTVFSYPCALEVEVAERLIEVIPCAESCRFLRTGGEAMSATFKLARAFTGRDRLLTCGYHGWLNTMGPGVPAATQSMSTALPWGDPSRFEDLLRSFDGEVAAISVAFSYSSTAEQATSFLTALRDLCDRYGALLIFDEIVTGFRLARGGAQERFGVVPDLAVFSKGMANGWPISVYCGRRDVMETVRKAVVSSTFGGEATALAAAHAAIDVYRSEDVIGHMETMGARFVGGLNALFAESGAPVEVLGLPQIGWVSWRDAPRAKAGELALRFDGELLRRGVITYTGNYITYSHSATDIDEGLRAAREALAAMQHDGLFAAN